MRCRRKGAEKGGGGPDTKIEGHWEHGEKRAEKCGTMGFCKGGMGPVHENGK